MCGVEKKNISSRLVVKTNLELKKSFRFVFVFRKIIVAVSILSQRASFQAAVISDGTETFLTFIYGHRALQVQQVSGNRISVGWGSSTNRRLGSQANYFNFDTVSGDTGKCGVKFST